MCLSNTSHGCQKDRFFFENCLCQDHPHLHGPSLLPGDRGPLLGLGPKAPSPGPGPPSTRTWWPGNGLVFSSPSRQQGLRHGAGHPSNPPTARRGHPVARGQMRTGRPRGGGDLMNRPRSRSGSLAPDPTPRGRGAHLQAAPRGLLGQNTV